MAWYWCLAHGRAETEDGGCPPPQRLGPYASREEAENYRERVEARNEAWDEQDEAWHGEDDD